MKQNAYLVEFFDFADNYLYERIIKAPNMDFAAMYIKGLLDNATGNEYYAEFWNANEIAPEHPSSVTLY